MTDIPDFVSAYNPILRGEVSPDEWSKKIRARAPAIVRPHETIEGGFIVVERTRRMRRLRPAPWPVEHGTMKEAVEAVERLRKRFPHKAFSILQQVAISEASD